MRYRLSMIALTITVVATGCASLSEQDCLLSDWQAIGYEDGVRGYSAARLGDHRKACTKHGVAPDLAAYRLGREAGLQEYCRAENGFQVGAAGGAYNGVCPVELAQEFSNAYFKGRRLYDLESDVRSASSRISGKRKRLDSIEADLAAKSALIVNEETTLEERVKLLAESRNLIAERGRLQGEMKRLKREKARRERKLAAYRSEIMDI